MTYEIRTYRLRNGAVPGYLRAVEDGIAIRKRHLGTVVGYRFSEIGPLNEIVHVRAYASLDDRDARRVALGAASEWQAFLPRIRDLVVSGDNKIMKPASFSPPLPTSSA